MNQVSHRSLRFQIRLTVQGICGRTFDFEFLLHLGDLYIHGRREEIKRMTTRAKKARVSRGQENPLLNFHPARKLSTQHFVLRNVSITVSRADENGNLNHCLFEKKKKDRLPMAPLAHHPCIPKQTNIRIGRRTRFCFLLLEWKRYRNLAPMYPILRADSSPRKFLLFQRRGTFSPYRYDSLILFINPPCSKISSQKL